MRFALVVLVSVIVLGGAYLMVRAPGSGSAVIVKPPSAPVRVAVTSRIDLGRAHVVLAGGAAGLFVVQDARRGPPGRITSVDTAKGRLMQPVRFDISPLGAAAGKDAVWVLGGAREGNQTTLLRFDPHTLRIAGRLVIAGASSCATNPFANCNPVVVNDGVWVPMLNRIVHVTPDGRTADRTVMLKGHVWDVAASGRWIWVLAETALLRIDSATGDYQRLSLRKTLGPGLHSNHLVASPGVVWISSFPTAAADLRISRLTMVSFTGGAMKVVQTLPYPGAGSLALVDGGLWVDRFDGQGEIDRLDSHDGSVTGPILLTRDDVTWIVARPSELWATLYRVSGNRRELVRITLTPTSTS